MKTILPKKANRQPVATDDETYDQMAADPSISEFEENTTYSTFVASSNQTASNTAPQVNVTTDQIKTAAAETTAANNAEVLVANTNDNWVNQKWRPAMGWMYMLVCTTDFVIFPVLWSVLQAISNGRVDNQWQPITLQGAGLFHIAMGAILGIAVYGRTKEKLEIAKTGN